MKATLLLLTLLATLPVSLAAQTRLQAERRIPLRLDATATSARDLEVTGELLLVREKLPALPADLPVSSTTEFRMRQSRTPLQGAKRGSAVGLVLGAGIGIFAGLKMTGDECRQPPGAGCMVYDVVKAAAPIFGGILGAGAGAFLGGVIGSVHPGERWVRISVPM